MPRILILTLGPIACECPSESRLIIVGNSGDQLHLQRNIELLV